MLCRDEDHLALFIELLGHMPRRICSTGKYAKDYFNRHGELRHIKKLRFWPLSRVLQEKYEFPVKEVRIVSPWSCHLRHIIEGVVRAEPIRYARNSSTRLDLIKTCHAFPNRERGFHPTFLKHLVARVGFKHCSIKRAERSLIPRLLLPTCRPFA